MTTLKRLDITEGVFSETALRITLQDVNTMNSYSLFLSNNFEFIAIKNTILWDETPYNLIDSYQHFGGPSFLHIQGN
jgi:hypothetical protein